MYLTQIIIAQIYNMKILTEKKKLEKIKSGKKNWRKWGPYLTERQWGTVREDYSEDGNAWEHVTYEDALSKAYRWGEDGIAGISDDKQQLCFAVALWNKKDPIIKERLFGLTGKQGNHGEDVKEYYYYLDNIPTHSYMKLLYKYPQKEFPYAKLIYENYRRNKHEAEYELIDTKIFDDDKYFDVYVEYAKIDAEDIMIRIKIFNRGDEEANLNVIPQLWFRNTWAWGYNDYKPDLQKINSNTIKIDHKHLKNYKLFCNGKPEIIFCDNETNTEKLYNVKNKRYAKDGINNYIIHNRHDEINYTNGTKVAVNYDIKIKAKSSRQIY